MSDRGMLVTAEECRQGMFVTAVEFWAGGCW